MLIEVVKLVALEVNELQLQEEPHAYQNFNNLSQTHLLWEQKKKNSWYLKTEYEY